jgi:ubiquinone/menaquinone biosynthesis C-methylase UbiE
MKNSNNNHSPKSSWQPVAKWYDRSVGSQGNYYHTHIVIPGALRLLHLKNSDRLLDVGCGQGVLARSIPKDVVYAGVDASGSLILSAQRQDRNPKHTYSIGDAAKPIMVHGTFSKSTLILALQNMESPSEVLKNIARKLDPHGILVIVLNHPCFRIPRQSSWGIDEQNKLQYRKINRYLTPLKIPITAHPGLRQSPVTWSYHFSLSDYSRFLFDTGFTMQKIEEWSSDRESEGKAARMENRSRSEIPLFMAIVAVKH